MVAAACAAPVTADAAEEAACVVVGSAVATVRSAACVGAGVGVGVVTVCAAACVVAAAAPVVAFATDFTGLVAACRAESAAAVVVFAAAEVVAVVVEGTVVTVSAAAWPAPVAAFVVDETVFTVAGGWAVTGPPVVAESTAFTAPEAAACTGPAAADVVAPVADETVFTVRGATCVVAPAAPAVADVAAPAALVAIDAPPTGPAALGPPTVEPQGVADEPPRDRRREATAGRPDPPRPADAVVAVRRMKAACATVAGPEEVALKAGLSTAASGPPSVPTRSSPAPWSSGTASSAMPARAAAPDVRTAGPVPAGVSACAAWRPITDRTPVGAPAR